MNQICRFAVITLFLAGLLSVGVFGTSASMTFVWPAYLVIGLAGVASVIAIVRRTKTSVPAWCLLFAFGVAGYVLIRGMDSPVAYFAREDCALVITCFIVYTLFLSMLDDSRWRRGLFWCIAGLLLANCGMAIIQLFGGGDVWILSAYSRTFPDRIGGLFNHPDHFAGFLGLGLPLLLSAIIFGRHARAVKISLAVLSGLCFLGIILAKSLLGLIGGLVGVGAMVIMVLLLSWKKMSPSTHKSIFKASGILFMLVGLFVIFNFSRITQLVGHQILTRGEVSLLSTWSSSVEQFCEAPILGTGSRTFCYYSRKFVTEQESPAQMESEFVHNEFLQVLGDYGLIGLILVLGFAIVHVQNGIRFVYGYVKFASVGGAILPVSNHLALVAGSVAALFTLGFLSCFDFVMHIPAIAVIATVFFGILACPDPMSCALRPEEETSYIPGGNCLFLGRGLAFGCGIALTLASLVFSRSEANYEMARINFESGTVDVKTFQYLEKARQQDPQNPFAKSLSAHCCVRGIQPGMASPIRFAHLEKAEGFFREAAFLYPQDINSAMAHSVVLDAMGRRSEAARRIQEARHWAPLYGNVIIAQAEHFLRHGDFDRAEKSYTMARDTNVFPVPGAITQGLAAVEKGRTTEKPFQIATQADLNRTRQLKEAKIRSVEFSGELDKALQDGIEKLEARLKTESRD